MDVPDLRKLTAALAARGLGPVKFELIPGKGVRPNQNLLVFTNGFKAGVDYYFSRAGGD